MELPSLYLDPPMLYMNAVTYQLKPGVFRKCCFLETKMVRHCLVGV